MTSEIDFEETSIKPLRKEFFAAVDATHRSYIGYGALEMPQDTIFSPTTLNDWEERRVAQGNIIQFHKSYDNGVEFNIIPEGEPTNTTWRVHTQMRGYQSYFASIHPSAAAALAFASGIVSGMTLDKGMFLVDAFQKAGFLGGAVPPEIKVKPQ